jgi:hypothetical protein
MKIKAFLTTTALLILPVSTLFTLSAAATSANISHPYKSTVALQPGTLVSLDSQRSGYIVPANTSNGVRLIGVVVTSQDSLVAVDANSGMAQVAIRGTVNTLVSTVGGDIKAGDKISVSPFNGVGMKATGDYMAIGTAETAFNSHSQGVISQTVTDKSGQRRSIDVGYTRLDIAINSPTTGPAKELSGFQKLGHSLTGRTLPTFRIVTSLIVALLTIVIVITLLYASVFGSVSSISRNPMAKRAVLGSLVSVLSMAGLTILLAGTIIFFLLR